MNATLSQPARIVVIDDHAIVRYGYAQLINHQNDLEICGMADSEHDGVDLVKRERPDLAIVDLSLKAGHGIELIKSLVAMCPQLKILVISAHDESMYAERVLDAGAQGYINKQEATDHLVDGIRALLRDEVYFSQSVTKSLLCGRGRSLTSDGGVHSLTSRELQVFERIGSGQSTRQIAETMDLSVKTVERYKENIKHKLRLDNATQLIQRATHWVLERDR